MMEQAPPQHEMDSITSPSPSSTSRHRRAAARRSRVRLVRIATLLVIVAAVWTGWWLLRSHSPTKAVTPQGRVDVIVAYINAITLTNRTIAYTPAKTENHNSNIAPPMSAVLPVEELALQWLIEQDSLGDTFPLSEAHKVRLSQRYALLTLWFQQNIALGPSVEQPPQEPLPSPHVSSSVATRSKTWTRSTGWATPTVHECDWYGVMCTTEAVTSIQLNLNNLRGTIPAELGLLTALTSFRVNTNYLVGQLPASIGQWTQLVNLSVYKNSLSGSLPESTRHWARVQSVLMHENQFNGTLPGVALSAWTHLENFNVISNAFTGTIPDAVGAAWAATLRYAQFSVNRLTGTLPPSLGLWTALEELRVSSNPLTGVVPDTVQKWKKLRLAYLQDTNLTGRMPVGICQLNLTTLVADCDTEVLGCQCCTYCF